MRRFKKSKRFELIDEFKEIYNSGLLIHSKNGTIYSLCQNVWFNKSLITDDEFSFISDNLIPAALAIRQNEKFICLNKQLSELLKSSFYRTFDKREDIREEIKDLKRTIFLIHGILDKLIIEE